MNRRISFSIPARVFTVVAIVVSMFAIPSGSAFAGSPTMQKNLAATQPVRNADGTFPSGSVVVYEVSIGCNAPGNCDGFELHDFTPSFTDVDLGTSYYEFQSATGAGPGALLDTTDPTETVITFPTFAAGTSFNVELTYLIPPGITPDNTTTTNTATWGEYLAGSPTANVVTDTQDVTSRARTSFDVRKTGPSIVNPNEDVTFTVSLCGDLPDDPYYGPLKGTILGATLTDVIPPGFTLVSAAPDGVEAPAGTVTWPLGDIELGPGDCVDRDITLNYPSAGPIVTPISTSNTVTAGGTYPAASDGNPGSATHPITIDNPSPGEPGIDKGRGRAYVDLDQTDGPGGVDDGDSFSSYYLRPRNTGQGVIFDAVLTDPIPDRFVVESVNTGTWPTGVVGPTGPNDDGDVEFVLTFEDTTTQTVLADGTTDDSIPIAAPTTNPLVSLTVNYGDLPAGWRQNGGGNRIELYGSFIDPGRSGGAAHNFATDPVLPVVNTATLAGQVANPVTGALGPVSLSDSATINIESPQPHVAIFKSVTATGNVFGSGVFPSNATTPTTLTWTVRARNDGSATADFPDPEIIDVLPTLTQNTLLQGGLTAPADFTLSAPAGVTCGGPVIGTVGGVPTGDPQINWGCTGDVAPGEEIEITFTTDVIEGTPPQTIVNRDYTTTNALTDLGTERFSFWDGGATNGTWQLDPDNLDGDAFINDRIRTASAQIDVIDFVFLTSVKEVRGGKAAVCKGGTFPPTGEDNDVYGTERCTRPGDIVDYQMTVTNDGNTDITNIMVMDIFPAIGDSFVVPNQTDGAVTARNSAFNTYLTGPVTSIDPNVVIEYSTALEPCRYEDFYGNTSQEVPGCAAPAWSTTAPEPISSVRSIRITYLDGGIGNLPATLPIGDTFVLEWPMRAAVAAQTDEIATNAFGWTAQSTTSATRNVAGPPPVDITVGALTDYVIGDLVWYDENYDGIQNDTPLNGVPLVPIGLFLDNQLPGNPGHGVLDVNDLFVQETVTDATPGSEGLYLFSGLPAGDYFVAFAPPSTWVVSPEFEGTDTAVDSNGTEDTAFSTLLWDPASVNGPLYDDVFVSDVITLGAANPVDPTIDLGLWRPDPSIDIEKATNAADVDNPTGAEDADTPTGRYIPAGQDVTWSYVVTNTGNTTLENVVVTDDLGTAAPGDDLSTTAVPATITCPSTTLLAGVSMTCTSTTPVPAIAGQYANVADVVGDPVLPPIPWTGGSYAELVRLDGSPFYDGTGAIIPVIDDDPSHYFGAVATIDIEKSTNLIPADAVGSTPSGPTVPTLDPVTWTYEVTIPAPGNVALADVLIVDDNGTPADTSDDLSTANTPSDFTFVSGDTDNDDRLDVNETWVFTAAAPNGAILGIYENGADVTGTPVTPSGTPIQNVDGSPMAKPIDDDPSHYYGVAFPAIDIEKATNGQDADTLTGPTIVAGEDVTWTYVITNIGNVDLRVTQFVDDRLGTITVCDEDVPGTPVFPVVLDPTESVTCTVTGTDAADFGQYTNLADVTGTPLDENGDVITENQTPAGPVPVVPPTDDDPSHYIGGGTPGIDIVKVTEGFVWNPVTEVFDPVAAGDGIAVTAGEPVTWTYTVTNTGEFALADVVVNDDNGTPADPLDDFLATYVSGDLDTDDLLDVDETWVFTASATGDFGGYINLGDTIGVATDPDGVPIVDQNGDDPFVDGSGDSIIVAEDPSGYVAGGTPGIDIVKVTEGFVWNPVTEVFDPVAAGDGIAVTAGEPVTWTYTVTNTGEFALADVVVNDDNGTPGDPLDDFLATYVSGDLDTDDLLDVDETWVFTASATGDFGGYINLGDTIGVATDPDGVPIVDQNGDDPFVDGSGDSIIVAEDPSGYVAGGTPGIDIVKVTEGFVWNPVTEVFDPVAAGDGIAVTAGEPVTWTYTVTNTGEFALADVVVNDDNGTPGDPLDDFLATYVSGDLDTDDLLDVDETWVFTTSAIANRGTYVNMADTIGVATDPDGVPIVDQNGDDPFVDGSGDSIIVAEDPSGYIADGGPAIDIEKTTNGFQADDPAGDQNDANNTVPYISVGSPVTWQYVITNTGDVDLLVDRFTDDRIADVSTLCAEGTLFPVTLAPTETITCTVAGTATMQPGDLYVNTSDVAGAPVDENGDPIVDQNGDPVFVDGNGDSTIVDVDPSAYFGASPAIDLEKSTNGFDADSAPGPFVPLDGEVTWTYVVTNTGNTNLADLVVTDSLEGEVCRIDALAIGASETCEIVLPASTLVGQYANDSNVAGQPVDQFGNPILDPTTGQPVPPVGDSDPSHYFGASPGIDIEKSTNGADADTGTGPFIVFGDDVEWSYVVENTGNVVLTNVVVTDDVVGEVCVIPVLGVGATETCTVTAASDVVGQYENVGDVTGTPSFPVDPDGDLTDPDNFDPITDPGTGDPVPDVDDDDPSHYYGIDVDIDIEKSTNGEDADTFPGPNITFGASVTWTFVVTNTGQTPLVDLVVDDDLVGQICIIPLLVPGASETCTAAGTAGTTPYVNVGSVTGTPAIPVNPDGDLGDPANYDPIDIDEPDDSDPSHHTPVPPVLLPTTGSDSSSPLPLAMMLIVAGVGLLLITRTRRARRRNASAT